MRNNPDVHQLVNGQTKCGMSTHLNTIQQLEKRKILIYAITRMHLKNMLSEESQIPKNKNGLVPVI